MFAEVCLLARASIRLHLVDLEVLVERKVDLTCLKPDLDYLATPTQLFIDLLIYTQQSTFNNHTPSRSAQYVLNL